MEAKRHLPPTCCPLATVPLPPLYRQRAVQIAARAALSITAAWLAAPPITGFLLSRRTGLRVSVRRIVISSARPALSGVIVRAKDGSELGRASLITFGGARQQPPKNEQSSSEKSDPSTSPPGATAHSPSFTVVFEKPDLRVSNWDVAEPSQWMPRFALTGKITLSVFVAGPPQVPVRIVRFGEVPVPPLCGFPGTNDLVRRFTRTALRRDQRGLPKEFQPGARRIAREAIIAEIETARTATANAVTEMRTAARKIDEVLEGLPDLEKYRVIARQSESLLRQIAGWLGRDSAVNRESATEESRQWVRPEEREYRILDEEYSRSR